MYEGQYFTDKKQGFGIFKWASGNIYRGQYKNDERDGIGEMHWTDGSIYIGQWSRGIQHGYGRMFFSDGTTKEGYFKNNVYKGPMRENIPPELADPNFDIMEFGPKDLPFSEEIKSMTKYQKGFPKTAEEFTQPVDTDYTNYTISSKPVRGKHDFRRANKVQQPYPPTTNKNGYYAPPSKVNRSFSISSKMVLKKRGFNRPTMSGQPYLPQNQRLQNRAKMRRNRKRKVWLPAGKARYIDIIQGPYAVY